MWNKLKLAVLITVQPGKLPMRRQVNPPDSLNKQRCTATEAYLGSVPYSKRATVQPGTLPLSLS